jgi:hypothetical protein
LYFHGSDIHSVHARISSNLLPKEYGGELESIEDINLKWIDYLKTNSRFLLSLTSYGVNLNEATKKVVKSTEGTYKKILIN